jgi:hypothetical protein
VRGEKKLIVKRPVRVLRVAFEYVEHEGISAAHQAQREIYQKPRRDGQQSYKYAAPRYPDVEPDVQTGKTAHRKQRSVTAQYQERFCHALIDGELTGFFYCHIRSYSKSSINGTLAEAPL